MVPSVTDSPSSGISTSVAAPVAAGASGAASFFGSSLTGSSSSAGAGASSAGAAAAFASPMRAMTAPTSTVSSSSARISTMVPATGDGISVSTLSVETSRSGSSTSTVSPTALSHWVMVPSVTDSPSSGISTSVAAPEAAGAAAAAGAASATGASSTAGAAACAGASVAGDSSASPIIAMTPPTSTVSSSSALISRMTPATGEGISVSTLSVETSSNGSSTSTVSPTDFNHWVIVPSVTDSPSSGISTENAIILRLLASRVVKTETNTPKDTDSICDVWCSGHIKLNRCPLQWACVQFIWS